MARHAGSHRRPTSALSRWVAVARAHGYLKKGASFKPLPKKGTEAYKKLKAAYSHA